MCIINCVPKIFLQSAHSVLPLPTPCKFPEVFLLLRRGSLTLTFSSNSESAQTTYMFENPPKKISPTPYAILPVPFKLALNRPEKVFKLRDCRNRQIHIRRGVPPVHGPPAHWQARVMFLKPQAKNTGISDFPAQLPLARNSNSTQASTDVLYQLMNAVVGNRESGRMRMHTPTNTFSSLASLLAQARAESRVTVPPVSLPVARKIQILEPAKC
ncbi:hypothetical protein C8F01DRAFT_1083414 [Mycena amicta]|nr:hypothetical protein C8F01DRAFT_1083414 [Mycena amicta]